QDQRGEGRLGLEEGDQPEDDREGAPERDKPPVAREFVNHRTLRSGGRGLHPHRCADVPLGAAAGGAQVSQRRRGIRNTPAGKLCTLCQESRAPEIPGAPCAPFSCSRRWTRRSRSPCSPPTCPGETQVDCAPGCEGG